MPDDTTAPGDLLPERRRRNYVQPDEQTRDTLAERGPAASGGLVAFGATDAAR
jgi:hypothetical protein